MYFNIKDVAVTYKEVLMYELKDGKSKPQVCPLEHLLFQSTSFINSQNSCRKAVYIPQNRSIENIQASKGQMEPEHSQQELRNFTACQKSGESSTKGT